MDNKSKVFICAAAAPEDQKIAKKLYNDLTKSGFTPWMESEDLRAGQNRQLMVRENIQNAGFFLVLLSSTSLSAKGDYHKKLNIALDILDEFPQDQIFVIPVHLDVCKPLDKRLQDRQAVNLFPSYNDGFKQILRAMKHQAKNNAAASKDSPDEEPMQDAKKETVNHNTPNADKEAISDDKRKKLIPVFIILLIIIVLAVIILKIPKSDKPQTWENKKLSMEFVKINGGCYMMGCSDEKCHSYEKPEHEVCVDDFWIGNTEVTQKQWDIITANNISTSKQDENSPINNVSWNEAHDFIDKLNKEERITQSDGIYRLPTEAEWEYVCRKGLGIIHNMRDNVWEWCEDVYNSEAYKQHEHNNPIMRSGSEQSEQRVTRGGSLGMSNACISRIGTPPDSKAEHIGFRLVRTKID